MTAFITSAPAHKSKTRRGQLFLSIAAAAVLALSACSSPATAPDAPSTASTQGQESSVAPSVETAAVPTAQKEQQQKQAVSKKVYSEAELTAILAGLKDEKGNPLTMTPAADLEKGQELQKTALADVKISPEECRQFANTNAALPEGSVFASGVWMDDPASGATTAVTLLSAKPSVLSATLDRAKDNSGACDNFTIKLAGQVIETTVKRLSVDTAADTEFGTLITQQLPTGGALNTMSVEALQDGLLISVVQLGQAAREASAPELAKVVNQVLAAS